MIFNGSADSDQLSILGKVLDDYCRQAGIAAGHPARERLGCRATELFQGGMDKPAELLAAMRFSYDEWLGEIDSPTASIQRPALWAVEAALTEPTLAETVGSGGGGASRFPQANAVDHSTNSSPRPFQGKDSE